MIRVICGDDEFAVSNALNERLDALTTPDLRDANVSVFDTPSVTLTEVMDTARAVPFMSDRRAIVVKNMLAPLEDRDTRPRGGWADLGEVIAEEGMSIANELIFVDYKPLRLSNPNLKPLAAIADVKRCPLPKRGELDKWIRERAAYSGLTISARGMARFASLAGDDLRRIDSELKKLALYADGRPLTDADIELMVSDAHEEGVWKVIDAVINRQSGDALAGLHNLIQNGQTLDGVLFLVGRQLGTLIMVSELLAQGVPRQQIGERLNIRFPWLLDKNVRQATQSGHQRLVRMHRDLLEIDFATKSGQLDRKLAVEILIAALAGR